MKILITGGSGQLGGEIINKSPKGFDLLIPNRDELDLSNKSNCIDYVERNKPDYIINTGAFTNVDKAEIQKDLCFSVNTEAPIAFAKVLKKYGGKLLQISTDYVFDGKKNSPYKTDDSRNPICEYGYTKAEAESRTENILGNNGQLLILRTSWLMGPKGDNFIKTMLKLHKKRNKFSVVSDQVGAMTSTMDLAKICWQIIMNWHLMENKNHILHWSCSGVASWYDIAMEIGFAAKKFKILEEVAEIMPISFKEYKALAKRPPYSVLDCSSSKKLLRTPLKYWRIELNEIFTKIEHFNKYL